VSILLLASAGSLGGVVESLVL